MSRVLLCFLFLPATIASSLPLCNPYQACSAQETRFALDEGSGWDIGSGEAPPLYDDLMPPLAHADYNSLLDSTRKELCQCLDNSTCSIQDDYTISLDQIVSISFCKPISQQLPSTCKTGMKRIPVRVIAEAQQLNFDTPANISQAIAFCLCPNGYKRAHPESWDFSQLSYSYTCK